MGINRYIWKSVHGTSELSSAMKKPDCKLMVTRLHKQQQSEMALFTVWYTNRNFSSLHIPNLSYSNTAL